MNLALISKENTKVARSISVALSVTDIGYIEYAEGLNLEFLFTESVIEPIDINAAVNKNLPVYEGSRTVFSFFRG